MKLPITSVTPDLLPRFTNLVGKYAIILMQITNWYSYSFPFNYLVQGITWTFKNLSSHSQWKAEEENAVSAR